MYIQDIGIRDIRFWENGFWDIGFQENGCFGKMSSLGKCIFEKISGLRNWNSEKWLWEKVYLEKLTLGNG